MDLRIRGKRALVCASVKGVGCGCAATLAKALNGSAAACDGIAVYQVRARRADSIPVGRCGSGDAFAQTCAFPRLPHAGGVDWQTPLLDGGATNATI